MAANGTSNGKSAPAQNGKLLEPGRGIEEQSRPVEQQPAGMLLNGFGGDQKAAPRTLSRRRRNTLGFLARRHAGARLGNSADAEQQGQRLQRLVHRPTFQDAAGIRPPGRLYPDCRYPV